MKKIKKYYKIINKDVKIGSKKKLKFRSGYRKPRVEGLNVGSYADDLFNL